MLLTLGLVVKAAAHIMGNLPVHQQMLNVSRHFSPAFMLFFTKRVKGPFESILILTEISDHLHQPNVCN